MNAPTLAETEALVRRLFEGVVDKGGEPYAEHCVRVARRLPSDVSDDARHAALLHDVVEDIGWNGDHFRANGYSERTIDLVRAVSRDPDITYQQWIERLAREGPREAVLIKIADNLDNSDPTRIAQLPPEQRSISRRYERSLKTLRAALRESGEG